MMGYPGPYATAATVALAVVLTGGDAARADRISGEASASVPARVQQVAFSLTPDKAETPEAPPVDVPKPTVAQPEPPAPEAATPADVPAPVLTPPDTIAPAPVPSDTAATAGQGPGRGLFEAGTPPQAVLDQVAAVQQEPTVVEAQAVKLRADVILDQIASDPHPPAFNPFPDAPLTVTKWEMREDLFGRSLIGTLPGTADTLVLIIESGHLRGRVSVGGRMVSVAPVDDGWHVATLRDPSGLPAEGVPGAAPGGADR